MLGETLSIRTPVALRGSSPKLLVLDTVLIGALQSSQRSIPKCSKPVPLIPTGSHIGRPAFD